MTWKYIRIFLLGLLVCFILVVGFPLWLPFAIGIIIYTEVTDDHGPIDRIGNLIDKLFGKDNNGGW